MQRHRVALRAPPAAARRTVHRRGIRGAGVLDSNSVFGLTSAPASIAIIGGGYIGLELACFFNEIGTRVQVYEMLPQIAAGCDREIAAKLLDVLTRRGIEFHLSCRVQRIEDGALHYQAADGTRQTATPESILNATGRAPV